MWPLSGDMYRSSQFFDSIWRTRNSEGRGEDVEGKGQRAMERATSYRAGEKGRPGRNKMSYAIVAASRGTTSGTASTSTRTATIVVFQAI